MIREYICDKCEIVISKQHKSIHSRLLRTCPECKGKVYQDLSGIYYYNECRSVGVKAERNSKSTSYEFQDRKRQDKIQTGLNKFNDAVNKGVIDKDQALDMVKKNIDYKPPWGEIDKNQKKKIFSGSNEEQAKKITKYIEKGE